MCNGDDNKAGCFALFLFLKRFFLFICYCWYEFRDTEESIRLTLICVFYFHTNFRFGTWPLFEHFFIYFSAIAVTRSMKPYFSLCKNLKSHHFWLNFDLFENFKKVSSFVFGDFSLAYFIFVIICNLLIFAISNTQIATQLPFKRLKSK